MPLNRELLAYCGLYCEQCSFKAAHDEQDARHLDAVPYPHTRLGLSAYGCDGCKGANCICTKCQMKPCASSKGLDSCAACDSFPCGFIEAFAHDGIPHHQSAVENLMAIRELGVESWYAGHRSSLRCHCGERQSWYYSCPLHGNR